MVNTIPGKCRTKLASPFMFVPSVHPDPRTWLLLFLLCYFHHDKDSNASCFKNQAHTLDGIVIGQSSTLNAILVYNPQNQWYYEPNSYRLKPHHIPLSVYPSITYNGGLFVTLHKYDSAPTSKPYPLETRVIEINPETRRPLNPAWSWKSLSTHIQCPITAALLGGWQRTGKEGGKMQRVGIGEPVWVGGSSWWGRASHTNASNRAACIVTATRGVKCSLAALNTKQPKDVFMFNGKIKMEFVPCLLQVLWGYVT